jgi:hypothetical protein
MSAPARSPAAGISPSLGRKLDCRDRLPRGAPGSRRPSLTSDGWGSPPPLDKVGGVGSRRGDGGTPVGDRRARFQREGKTIVGSSKARMWATNSSDSPEPTPGCLVPIGKVTASVIEVETGLPSTSASGRGSSPAGRWVVFAPELRGRPPNHPTGRRRVGCCPRLPGGPEQIRPRVQEIMGPLQTNRPIRDSNARWINCRQFLNRAGRVTSRAGGLAPGWNGGTWSDPGNESGQTRGIPAGRAPDDPGFPWSSRALLLPSSSS